MKITAPPQEDITSLFGKFGGDAGGYKVFDPVQMPGPAPAAQIRVLSPAPVQVVTVAREVLPSRAFERSPVRGAPRELDAIFNRLLQAGHRAPLPLRAPATAFQSIGANLRASTSTPSVPS